MKDTDKLDLRDAAGGCILPVKVVPGSSRDRIAGVLGESLKIAVTAPPERGRANKAVAAVLSEALLLPPKAITIACGPTSPRKEFLIANVSAQHVREVLAGLEI